MDEEEETVSITVPKKNGHGKDIEELLEIARRLEIAKMEKMEQQAIAEKLKNAVRRGEYLKKESVYDDIMLYIDKLHSNIERLADSYLSDLGGQIVDAGKVMPEHRTKWKDEVMSQIDEAKRITMDRVKEIQKAQAE